MIIALAICTHNRRALLAQTLSHLARIEVPAGVSLVPVLVTNACTDGSADLIGSWSAPFALRHVDEPQPGLSHARNRALSVARELGAQFVIWCDDDVILSPDFLRGYVDAFVTFPEVSVFGGRILPHFVPPTPPGLPRVIEAVGLHPFSCLDYGAERRLMCGGDLPFGANMAVRLEMVGDRCFDPRLGVTPTRKVGFEETSFLRELLDGDPWLYVPASPLQHVLPPSRQSLQAVAQYHRAIGHYEALVAMQRRTKIATVFGVPRWAIRAVLTRLLCAAVARLRSRDRYASLRDECEIHRTLGFIEAYGRDEAPAVQHLIR